VTRTSIDTLDVSIYFVESLKVIWITVGFYRQADNTEFCTVK